MSTERKNSQEALTNDDSGQLNMRELEAVVGGVTLTPSSMIQKPPTSNVSASMITSTSSTTHTDDWSAPL